MNSENFQRLDRKLDYLIDLAKVGGLGEQNLESTVTFEEEMEAYDRLHQRRREETALEREAYLEAIAKGIEVEPMLQKRNNLTQKYEELDTKIEFIEKDLNERIEQLNLTDWDKKDIIRTQESLKEEIDKLGKQQLEFIREEISLKTKIELFESKLKYLEEGVITKTMLTNWFIYGAGVLVGICYFIIIILA